MKKFGKKNNVTFIIIFVFIQLIFSTLIIKNYRRYLEPQISYLNSLTLNEYKNYFNDIKNSLKKKADIEIIDIGISLKEKLLLECMRKNYPPTYFESLSPSYEKEKCEGVEWVNANLITKNKVYPIKIRAKGNRELHRKEFYQMSFKIDIRGEERYKGMEEFSIQLPVIRNYTYELIAAELMKKNNIITPRHSYIKLFINGKYVGIRHLEENISKELIESNKKRYGPIFSVDESIPLLEKPSFKLNNFKYWKNQKSDIHLYAWTILENSQKKDQSLFSVIDINKWAKYFALVDIINAHHGAQEKSVKYFFNPVSSLFEPIFFDGHIEPKFSQFLIVDFVYNDSEVNFNHHLYYRKRFLKEFFGSKEKPFIEFYVLYRKYLEEFSSESYQDMINEKINDLSPLRGELYKSISKADMRYYQSILPHIFNRTFLLERSNMIRKMIIDSHKNVPEYSFNSSNKNLKFLNKNSILPQILISKCNDRIISKHLLIRNKEELIELLSSKQCIKNKQRFYLNNKELSINLE